MTAESDPMIASLNWDLAKHASQIAAIFKKEYKPRVSIIIRFANPPEGWDGDTICMPTGEKPEDVIATINKRTQEQEP